MDLNRPELLAIYMNDHLAGSTGGGELARRTRSSNEGTPFGEALALLCGEIEEDRASLESIMEDLGVGRSRTKPALGWLGEKLARLKPNGQLRGYSPLSRVIELEGLVLGITGKLRLWRLLDDLVGERTTADLPALIARAANEGTEFGAPLAALCAEIESDRETLETVMEELGVARSRIKPAIGWLGEKLGRLKPNGQLRGYSPLSRVIEMELLLLGISGKLRLWALLDELVGARGKADFDALAKRAEGQRAKVEDLQVEAARLL